MDFFRLSKISRPSSTPVTMDAKLSSKRIMSAACLETSEPAIPIATPETQYNISHCTKYLMIPTHNSSALADYAVCYLLETQQLQVYKFNVIQSEPPKSQI